MPENTEAQFMKRAIELGHDAMKLGNSPVGSVISQYGQVIGEGLELGKTKNDITFHAEIEAIRDALAKLDTNKLPGTTLYTTHEPCLMCSYAIRHYQIEKVVYGLPVQDVGGHTSGFDVLQTTTVAHWGPTPEIIGGFMKTDCSDLNNEYKQLKSKK
ncbi:nucleoside deaminase [Roseivirga sp. E12]|uniref:nucleoside deaminase n=1 Tax=Roseivirga sp. E12 TaxID=2819237 RepID=UPI001ABBE74F|nr:nucleoside deaminase [Roseivirga sp. E12]MBO3700621.1 nucleoside deaminase [Roseivirga sp. E12]